VRPGRNNFEDLLDKPVWGKNVHHCECSHAHDEANTCPAVDVADEGKNATDVQTPPSNDHDVTLAIEIGMPVASKEDDDSDN
jgi:hypothetical protein